MWPQTEAHSFIWCPSTEKRCLPTLEEKPTWKVHCPQTVWTGFYEQKSIQGWFSFHMILTSYPDTWAQLLRAAADCHSLPLEEPVERLLKELTRLPGPLTASSESVTCEGLHIGWPWGHTTVSKARVPLSVIACLLWQAFFPLLQKKELLKWCGSWN